MFVMNHSILKYKKRVISVVLTLSRTRINVCLGFTLDLLTFLLRLLAVQLTWLHGPITESSEEVGFLLCGHDGAAGAHSDRIWCVVQRQNHGTFFWTEASGQADIRTRFVCWWPWLGVRHQWSENKQGRRHGGWIWNKRPTIKWNYYHDVATVTSDTK